MPGDQVQPTPRILLTQAELTAIANAVDRAEGIGEHAERLLAELTLARQILDGCPAGIAVMDRELRYLYVNEALALLNGVPAADHIGRRLRDVLPDLESSEQLLEQVLRTGVPQVVTVGGQTPADGTGNGTDDGTGDGTADGTGDRTGDSRWWLGAYHRLSTSSGEIIGVAGVLLEITDALRGREHLVRAGNRMALLDEANRATGATLDLRQACQALADLLVPRFADYAAVDVVDPEGTPRVPSEHYPLRLRRIALSTTPDLAEASSPLGRLGEFVIYRAGSPMARVLADRRPLILSHPDDESMRQFSPSPERKEHLLRMGAHSGIYLPLAVREDLVGAVMVFRAGNSPQLTDADGELLGDLTDRAATGIAHAVRYTHEHETALEMQRAYLNAPTVTGPGVETLGRYLPAGSGAEVGGDWYDTLALPHGRTLLVVGDVMGHGVRAAAAMSEYRSVLRTLAIQGSTPDLILLQAERTALTLELDRVATCLLALLDPHRERATFSNAGHIPPLLVTPDGTRTLLDLPVAPPLGVGLGSFAATTVPLPPGSVLLLCTDGLVERRDRDIETGLHTLATLPITPTAPLPTLLDTVITHLDPAASEDDVAILLARTTRPGG
ncbi:SpoIIE family protein phosphatase [Streptomyces sp. NBC_00878]|uniref:SpoIIE family protein phosphatase n=1 Tax=Streptomyces sp. NBC_00878 TaxID=2975854 RepID=UPI00224CCFCF|nr:SpoIIE family protein phosphatase [Streptomyces sp. NBC_00878]MCX4907299.1 SpoIIE family protein phosphatase [Streptomyces sp. NBC_00878]